MPSPSQVCFRSVGPLILFRGTGQAWYRRGLGASTGRIPVWHREGEEGWDAKIGEEQELDQEAIEGRFIVHRNMSA